MLRTASLAGVAMFHSDQLAKTVFYPCTPQSPHRGLFPHPLISQCNYPQIGYRVSDVNKCIGDDTRSPRSRNTQTALGKNRRQSNEQTDR